MPSTSVFQMPIIPSTTGTFVASGSSRKCSSTVRNPARNSPEAVGADGDHQRQADHRVDGVAPADPLPELEHVGGVDAERGDLVGVRAHGDEVAGHGVLAERGDEPVAGGTGVGQRLDRGERLRRHDEQGLGRVEAGQRLDDVGAVDVGHEAGGDLRVAVRPQRPVGHRRTEVGAADADVDDGADAPPGRSRPRAVADLLGEGAGAVEHGVDLGHDVATVDLDDGVRRGSQRDVQHGSALGDVDRLTGEHRITTCRHPGRLGHGEQRGHHGVVDALLGVVDSQITDVQHVALGAARVRRQELA